MHRCGNLGLQPERRDRPAHKFETYKDQSGEVRVRFTYPSEVMLSTECYASRAAAKNASDSIRKNGPDAPVDDITD